MIEFGATSYLKFIIQSFKIMILALPA